MGLNRVNSQTVRTHFSQDTSLQNITIIWKKAELKKIVLQYKNGDDEVRAKLQKRYGALRIKKALEEYQSMDLIERTSKQCPKCKTWLQVEFVSFFKKFASCQSRKIYLIVIRNWMAVIR
jgi:hypothetical protein